MNSDTENYFYQLKDLLKNKGNQIKKDELRDFYVVASNYCNQQIRKGNTPFYKEFFDINVSMVEQKISYIGKYIDIRTVKNLVTIGLRIGKAKWLEQFIEDVLKEVVPHYRKSVYALNKSLWHFHHQEYNEALPLLLQIENIDVFFNLDCRGLLLKCYYELNETDAFFSLADALRKFVNQQPIASTQKKAYLNFIRQTVKLYKIKLHPNKYLKDKDKQNLKNIQPINNKQWLMEKAKEL